MKIEILIRDEQPVNERYVRAPISMEAMRIMTVEERLTALYEQFLRVYYEMTGEAFE